MNCFLSVSYFRPWAFFRTLKKAQGQKFETEGIQFIDFISIIPFGIIIWDYLYLYGFDLVYFSIALSVFQNINP